MVISKTLLAIFEFLSPFQVMAVKPKTKVFDARFQHTLYNISKTKRKLKNLEQGFGEEAFGRTCAKFEGNRTERSEVKRL